MTDARGSQIYGTLLGDAEIAADFSDRAHIRALLDVEAALARAQARLALIPAAAAEAIAEAARDLDIEPQDLTAPTLQAGLPVIALVARLREAVGGAAADHVHWGATSQDIMDTALVLTLRTVTGRLRASADALMAQLSALAVAHRDTLMAARTRTQQAVPTTFGTKVAGWTAPLLRHRRRLDEIEPRLLVVQLGGAAGTLAPFGGEGPALAGALAEELGLGRPAMPWHNQRDTLVEIAGWLAALNGMLGKIGQDIVLMAQSEVAELRVAGGGSSTMPQKSNPVLAEVLVTLARHAAGLAGTMQGAAVHAHERDGAAWTGEWLVLPQLCETAAAGLRHALSLVASLEVDAGRMQSNLMAASGTIMAEAASFALAGHMPLAEAKALVGRGCAECVDSGQTLAGWLREHSDVDLDWEAVSKPENWLGATGEIVDRLKADVDMALADQPAGS